MHPDVAAAAERDAVARGHVHAVGPRVDRVGEEPRAVRAEGGEQRRDLRAGEVTREDDAVVDGDVVVVDRDVEAGDRGQGETGGRVRGGLGFQRLGAEHLRRGRRHRQGQRFDRHQAAADADEVRRGRREKGLAERGGAEAGADAAAEDDVAGGLHAHRQLAVDGVAEVAVVFGAAGEAEPQPAEEVSLDVDVTRHAVARLVDFVCRPEPREDLCADRGHAARDVGDAAVAIRVRLAGSDLIEVATELAAERESNGRVPWARDFAEATWLVSAAREWRRVDGLCRRR